MLEVIWCLTDRNHTSRNVGSSSQCGCSNWQANSLVGKWEFPLYPKYPILLIFYVDIYKYFGILWLLLLFLTKEHPSLWQLQQWWGLEKKEKSFPLSLQCNERWQHFSLLQWERQPQSIFRMKPQWKNALCTVEEDALYLVGKKSYKKCLANISSKFGLLNSFQLSL